MNAVKLEENNFSLLFLILPTIFLIISYLFYPNILSYSDQQLLGIPLFIGLILLLIGFAYKKEFIAGWLKIFGWIVFAFFWSSQFKSFYFAEGGDFVNAFICIVGVYVLFYIAYREWFSIQKKETIGCLNWIAGASAIAGIIYYGFELTPLKDWLIEIVAAQSGWLLNIFTGTITVQNDVILHNDSYVVTIIFACTAVQSMVIFVGMILALKNVEKKRMLYGFLVTVVPIYFLNLIRNASIVYLLAYDITDFSTAHNVIGKGGSLIALIVLLFIVIKFVPEVFDEIMCLTDLPKRKGPIERLFKK